MSESRPDQFGYYESYSYSDRGSSNPAKRPILTNPMRLLDRKIIPINDRLMDVLSKLYEALSPPGSKHIAPPDGRLISMSITEDNKISMVCLLVHDIPHKKVLAYQSWIKERLGNPKVVPTRNLMNIYWTNPIDSNTKIMELAHIITFMGAATLADEWDLAEGEFFVPTYKKSIAIPDNQ